MINASGLGPPSDEEIAEREGYTRQLQDLAQCLVDDTRFHGVLTRVGLGGEFTEEETRYMNEELGVDGYLPHLRHLVVLRPDHIGTMQSLARRIVLGQFKNAHTPQAHDFVFERTFAFQGNPKWYSRIEDVRISFDDFYTVLKEYHQWWHETGLIYELRKELRRQKEALEAAGEPYNEDDLAQDVFWPLDLEDRRLFRKYGLICTASVRGWPTPIELENLDINDAECIRARVMRLADARGLKDD